MDETIPSIDSFFAMTQWWTLCYNMRFATSRTVARGSASIGFMLHISQPRTDLAFCLVSRKRSRSIKLITPNISPAGFTTGTEDRHLTVIVSAIFSTLSSMGTEMTQWVMISAIDLFTFTISTTKSD